MKHLYVIRHGLAGEPLENAEEDELRALTKKGKKELKSISKALKDLDIEFDEIITSPLIRALETAEIVHGRCGNSNELIINDLLRNGSSFETLVKYLNSLKSADSVAIVGHEPHLSSFASYCISGKKSSFINLKKGAVLLLEIDQIIKPGNSKLMWLLEPRQLILCEKN